MTDIGEEMIDRLPETSALRNIDNPMRNIIVNGIGGWFQDCDDKEFFSQFFIQEASGKYLDLHGQTFGVKRKLDESDEDYLQRIIYLTLSHLTVDFLRDVYNVNVYNRVSDFNVNDNDLTSDNPYLASNKFMGVVDEDTQNILNKMFVLGAGFKWL